jgi:hypothetical protein
MATNSKPSRKSVTTLVHEEASRKNILTAECQSVPDAKRESWVGSAVD